MTEKEYVIFCDESDRRGKFYSNFYGGVRVPASFLNATNAALAAKKQQLGLTSEIKWEKVDLGVVERYEQLLHAFFDEIAAGRIFMRVMFTQNARVPVGLSPEQNADSYYLLYYQFLKHGFGLAHIPSMPRRPESGSTSTRSAIRGNRSRSSRASSKGWPTRKRFARPAESSSNPQLSPKCDPTTTS